MNVKRFEELADAGTFGFEDRVPGIITVFGKFAGVALTGQYNAGQEEVYAIHAEYDNEDKLIEALVTLRRMT